MTILWDYVILLVGDYTNATEVFVIKLVLGVICSWIGFKEIEIIDLNDDSKLLPE